MGFKTKALFGFGGFSAPPMDLFPAVLTLFLPCWVLKILTWGINLLLLDGSRAEHQSPPTGVYFTVGVHLLRPGLTPNRSLTIVVFKVILKVLAHLQLPLLATLYQTQKSFYREGCSWTNRNEDQADKRDARHAVHLMLAIVRIDSNRNRPSRSMFFCGSKITTFQNHISSESKFCHNSTVDD